jgi:ribonuclease E
MLDSERSSNESNDNQANGRAYEDSASAGPGASGTGAPAGVPAAVFQAPQVLFQPPAPVAPASPPSPPSPPAPSQPESGGGRGGRGSRGSRSAKNADADTADETSGRTQDADSGPEAAGDGDEGGGRRRRRRNGRSRGKSADDTESADAESAVSAPDGPGGEASDSAADSGEAAAAEDSDAAESSESSADAEEGTAASRRRRRKRRRGGSGDGDVSAPDDPPDTVVHVREPHNPADDVRAIKGSTRLEAKKQRRREGRESGRRRPPVITESEFLARRESVDRTMVVRQRGDRTQIAVLEDGVLVEHYVNRTTHQSYVGNVYLGKVQNVLPSMEAAFVDIGKGRNAVLYAGEVNFDASGLEGQPKRIESALKPGQSVIVQVTKDPVGHKGARLTSQVSLPGRYLVYVPGASMTGISRKLPDTERNRLKHILKKVMPENAGVIVRTAAEGAAEAELDRDVTRLTAQWEAIGKKAKTASAPALLYGEPDLTIRVVRDVFNEDFSKLIVSGDEGWEVIDEYVRYVAPHLAGRLTRWDGDDLDPAESDGVFAEYRIDEQLAKALERKVWLPSGGSLVIDRTEAMTVVDVNTGKFTGQGGNLEETVTRNNLEAAEEIVRQLRLRDVGGIVVIDFIDMVLESNRELVLRRLLECLARDRTKHQVAEVTSLGLVQMTRKRVGAGLLEAFSETCECCNGRGVIITLDPAEPSHRSSAGHSGGSANSRRPGRSGGTDTDERSDRSDRSERSERGGRRGKRDGRGAGSAAATAAVSAAKIAASAAAMSAAPTVAPETSTTAEPEVSSVPDTATVYDGATASGTSPAPDSAASSEAPEASATKSSVPPVSAWAVSTSPADDSPVTVAVSVPSGAEQAVVNTAESAPPVRRTRTRAGSAVARKAETPAPSASTPAEPVTDAAPVSEAAPVADAAPATEAEVVATEAEPAAEAPAAETAPTADPTPEVPVADADSAEAAPQDAAPVTDLATEAPAAMETANEAAPTEPGESPDVAEAPAAEAAAPEAERPEPEAEQPEPVAEAQTSLEAEPASWPEPAADAEPPADAVTASEAATEPESASAPEPATVADEPAADSQSAPEPVAADLAPDTAPAQDTALAQDTAPAADAIPEPEPASAQEPPADDGFPFWK